MMSKSKFWDVLDSSILNQDRRHSKDVSLYPSEASAVVTDEYGETLVIGGCKRKAWFRNKLQRIERNKPHQTNKVDNIVAKEFSASDLWKFKLSSGVERDLHHESQRADVWFNHSHKFEWRIPVEGYEDALVRGEVDLVVLDEPGSEKKIGVEVKSITGYYGQRIVFGAKSRKGHWLQEPEPKADNLLQATLYTMVFVILTKLFEEFKLVYISRENGKRCEFDITLVEETQEDQSVRHRVYVDGSPYKYPLYAEDLVDSYKDLHRMVIDDIVPPRDFELYYTDHRIKKMYERNQLTKTEKTAYEQRGKLPKPKGDWQCSYCAYNSMCYTKSGDPIEYESTEHVEEVAQEMPTQAPAAFKFVDAHELF